MTINNTRDPRLPVWPPHPLIHPGDRQCLNLIGLLVLLCYSGNFLEDF